MTSGPWSPTDLARAVAMRTDGATPDAIAAALGRSAASVVGRLHRARAEGHAVPLDRVVTPWTPERGDIALSMWCEGAQLDDIAAAVGATPKATAAYVERMRRTCAWVERPGAWRRPRAPVPPPPPDRRRGRAWSPERVAAFAAAWNAGATREELGAAFGLTPGSAAMRVKKLREDGVHMERRRNPHRPSPPVAQVATPAPPVAPPVAPVDAPESQGWFRRIFTRRRDPS